VLAEAVVHGAGTSFLIDLLYLTHPQDAKQDAKLWLFIWELMEREAHTLEHLFN
jgi:hypothetical protein